MDSDSTGAGGIEGALATLGVPRRRAAPVAFRLVLGAAVGVVVLALLLRRVDLGNVGARLAQANVGWLVCAGASVLATTIAKIGRWRILFPRKLRPAVPLLGRALLIGQLANYLLPLRAGEAVRAYIIRSEGGGSGATALATIAAEKLYDVLLLVVLGGLVSTIAPLPAWATGSLGALAAAGLALIALTIAVPSERVLSWIARFRRRLPGRFGPQLETLARNGLAGIRSLRDPRAALTACLWSAVVWVLAASTNVLVFRAIGLGTDPGAALLQLLVHMAPLPAHTPGRIGEHQGLTVLGLSPYGVEATSQIAYAFALYAVVYIPQVLLGVVALALTLSAPRRGTSGDLGDRAGI